MVSNKDQRGYGKPQVEGHSSASVVPERSDEKSKRRRLDRDGLAFENSDTTLTVVTRDDCSPAHSLPTGRLEAASNHLVCRTCTFNNRASWASGAPVLPLPTFCAVCLQPLQPPSVESRGLTHQPSPEELRGSNGRGIRSTSMSAPPSSDCSTLESTRKAITERKCPICTIILIDKGDATICHLCGSVFALPSQMGMECGACTFRNDPGAIICAVCKTPLVHGSNGCAGTDNDVSTALLSTALDQESSHAGKEAYYRSSAGIVIPTASELTVRTIEEAGNSDAATEGLIPRLQQRLIDEHGKRVGEGAWSNQVQRTGLGRGGLAGRLNGVGAKKGDAEWRLCDPRTAHCTQLGSEGSEFSCGYRNIQMMCSALIEWPEYRRVLFGGSGFIPGILLLQCWIERAWADGYDPEGCEQLGGPGSLMGSEKWIGATECAALLRSFGVKADVVDFESSSLGSDAPLETPPPTGIKEVARADADAPCTQGTRREKPGYPRTAARCDRVLQKKQQSIRSYFPSKDPGGGRDSPSKDECSVTSDPGGEGPAPLAVEPRSGGHRGTESRESNAARADSGNSDEIGGVGDDIWAWRRRGQLMLGRGGWRGGRRGRFGNIRREAGQRMGRAIIEWTWEYFRTSRDAGQVFAVSSCSFSAQPREELRNAKSDAATARSRPCGLGMPLSTRASPWGTVEARARGCCSVEGGGGNVVARGVPTTIEKKMSRSGETARVTRTRPPPPLYFQHDGHSRSIVGVLRPGGGGQSAGHERGKGGRCLTNIVAGQGIENRGVGCADRNFEAGDFHSRQVGSLLVFDPSQPGSVIRRALDDKGTKRPWCSLLKRGENSLHRRQFQIVAVRPGLIEVGQANSWKKLVSTKISVK